MSKLLKLGDCLHSWKDFSPTPCGVCVCVHTCMGRRVRRDYCSHYFNSESLTLLMSLQIYQLCIHCHGDFLPHFLASQRKSLNEKCLLLCY